MSSAAKQAIHLVYCVAGYENFPEKRVEYQEKDIADIAQQSSDSHQGACTRPQAPSRMMELLDNPQRSRTGSCATRAPSARSSS